MAALSEWYGADASSGDEILSIRLFGSKARGDFEADSDLDVLVLATHDEWQFRQAVSFLAADISLSGERLSALR